MKTLSEYIKGLDIKKLRKMRTLVSEELRRKENRAFIDMVRGKKEEK